MEETIKVEKLSKSYSHIRAVENLNIYVGRGEVFGLLGANGAGKSTTIECMLGTKKQDSGSVSILGMNPSQDRKKLFEKVGVQFQEANYQEKITVQELCEVTQSLYKTTSGYLALLKQFGLSDKLKSQISELSGGQKQRAAVARALITKPQLILADEPTGALDSKATDQLLKMFGQINQDGQTILLVTHSIKAASHAKRVLFIKDGEVFHQLYRGNMSNEEMFEKISNTLTVITVGGGLRE